MRIDFTTDGTSAYALQIATPSLGDHSYLIVVDGVAAAIDIQRDLDRFDQILSGIDADVVAVLETHIHNDYVSGGMRLAETVGATYVLPEDSGAPYEHRAVTDGDVIDLGPWRLRAMHTPGHTFNHMSYVLESPSGPMAVFSGGSMLVGAVGRSDLLGADHTDALLAHQYASIHRMADDLDEPTVVAPTHGTGSFCSASTVADSTSTIELERGRNPALLAPSAEVFATGQKAGYKVFPAYYRHMAPANLEPLGAPPSDPLPLMLSLEAIGDATIVDVRDFEEYAAGHLAGSISIPLSNDAAVYLGWVRPWNEDVALVGREERVAEIRRQLARIGWDAVVGRIEPDHLGDLAEMLVTTETIVWSDVDPDGAGIVDVRDPVEHANGVIDGATLVHLADFAADAGAHVGDRAVIHCEGGYRAAIAAGFAEQAGASVVVVRDQMANNRIPLVAPPS